jgi:hypothetical protein
MYTGNCIFSCAKQHCDFIIIILICAICHFDLIARPNTYPLPISFLRHCLVFPLLSNYTTNSRLMVMECKTVNNICFMQYMYGRHIRKLEMRLNSVGSDLAARLPANITSTA